MEASIIIRKAEEKDIDFIVEAIIESAKSGTHINFYCTLFSISDEELKDILHTILLEDFPGHDFYRPGFLIAEVGGHLAGTCCSWIEGEFGEASTIIKANLFLAFLGHDRLSAAKSNFDLIHNLHFDREFGALQIENVYVHPNFRGLGLSNKLITEHIEQYKNKLDSLTKVQIILTKTNDFAFKSYFKLGFQIKAEKHEENDKVLEIFPSKSILLMEKFFA